VARFSDVTQLPREEAVRLVQLYRRKNPKVGELWKKLENNLRLAVTAPEKRFTIELPSGRKLNYKEPNNNEGHLSAMVVRGGQFVRLKWWGGSLTENLVQATARDVFMESVRAIREAGLSIVMRVHDEVVVCVHDDQAEEAKKFILDVMSTPPEWAQTLPLAAEAKITKKYEK
jgi:DNA polymerase